MSEKHHYIPISKVQQGMVLANELLDKQGQVLLPTGFVLTEKTISSLLHHDIHQVSILIADLEAENELEGDESENKILRLNTIFRHAPFEEPRSSLAELIKKYRLANININDKGDLL